ncbi:MAG: hypothetical protein U9N83_12190 [Thermodesulfobacteriota bacterium]|nr:hypothetical protein [Thermodesulfobacteriota bacterium]
MNQVSGFTAKGVVEHPAKQVVKTGDECELKEPASSYSAWSRPQMPRQMPKRTSFSVARITE